MFDSVFAFIRSLYPGRAVIPLHEPRFSAREKALTAQAIDSTFVSSVGKFVEDLEAGIRALTGARHAVATVNGTSALHAALVAGGVGPGDEVITQPLTFVATANAISYCGAQPLFVDVDSATLGLSAEVLEDFCQGDTFIRDGGCVNRRSGRRIAACVPMHTFGHPCQIERIADICRRYHILLVEDAAEALGSTYRGQHAGTFGDMGVFSFNGNKIITGGGGGMVVTNDAASAQLLKHLTTTAKLAHPWLYEHDRIGYNYRLPNLNAALLCAQMERLDAFLADKRALAESYATFFATVPGVDFVTEPTEARSNHWLNAILLADRSQRDAFLEEGQRQGVSCRPVWNLLPTLPMYRDCQTMGLDTARSLAERLVNIPSSARV